MWSNQPYYKSQNPKSWPNPPTTPSTPSSTHACLSKNVGTRLEREREEKGKGKGERKREGGGEEEE